MKIPESQEPPTRHFTLINVTISKSYTCVFQTLANLLYEAASECGYVDPTKVEQILGVSKQEAAFPEKPVPG